MKYLVYAELRVSFAVEVNADTAEAAEMMGINQMPGANLQDVDIAGDWEVLSITDAHGNEVFGG